MKKITTTDELIVELINLKSQTNVKVYTRTKPKFNKKGRESKQLLTETFANADKITKNSITTGVMVFDYGKVKAEYDKKNNVLPSTKPPKEPWHIQVSTNGVVRAHKTNLEKYLFMLADVKQETGSYYLNENEMIIPKEHLVEFLPKEYSSEKESIPIRMFKLDNIMKIECNNFIFEKE